ncbi:MAG: GNAT family N-acetyltransferase [Oscillospiraceae bacterium]|jgi:predicted acetyltransferase|nr:GNAT family N-acetyltransferase [Oscillospiraceae bacterium]
MREIRTLRGDEIEALEKIGTIAFNSRRDYSQKKPEDELARLDEWHWGAFDESGRLESGMVIIPYRMRFDGHTAGMAGVSGVCTLPEHRRGGNVYAILQRVLEIEYEKGTEFSSLTPFSHSFYRRMGYELCNCRNELTASMESFRRYKAEGSFTQYLHGDPADDLTKIQTGYIDDLNHAIPRDKVHPSLGWSRFTREDPYKTGIYLYVWRDGSGEPRSYVKIEQEPQPARAWVIKELAFMDTEALYGALSLLSSLTGQTVRWQAPSFIPFTDIVPDNWDITLKLIPRDMTRVVNVQRVLELARRPKGSGEYRVEVIDPQLPGNTGVYCVEYDNDSVSVKKTSRRPDLTASIQAFSQLATGFRALDDALLTRRDDLKLHGNIDILRGVFTARRQHLTEEF